MFSKHKTFNLFYLLIGILNCIAFLVDDELLTLVSIPLTGMSLILYLIICTKLESDFHKLIFAGLVMSLAGDVQMLFSSGRGFYFSSALIASMISYVLFASAYFIDFKSNTKKSKRIGNVYLVLLLLINFYFYYCAEYNLSPIKYQAILYAVVLSTMIFLSDLRHKRVNQSSFKMIFTGNFAFLISDLSFGYYFFIHDDSIMMAIYITTSLIAQYLVVIGSIERKTVNHI